MTPSEAQQIIEKLASGIDPFTGEILPDDNPVSNPHAIRALFIASRALEDSTLKKKGKKTSGVEPEMAGKPWTEAEDQRLLNGFESGETLEALANAHARTLGGIEARLERHGRMTRSPSSPSE